MVDEGSVTVKDDRSFLRGRGSGVNGGDSPAQGAGIDAKGGAILLHDEAIDAKEDVISPW